VVNDPTRFLTEPQADDSISAGYVTATSFMDAVSLTHWLNEAIEGMTGRNLIEEFVEPIVGNWEVIANFGIAVNNAGRCLQEIGINVQQTIYTLDASWDGNASDAAYRYFTDLAVDITNARTPLSEAAKQYDDLAHGMWVAADTLAGIIKQAVDAALIAVVGYAAGTITLETVVGPIVGYAVGTLEIIRILELINRCAAVATSANALIFGAIGAITLGSNEVGKLKTLALPGTAYNNPAVA
jgi:hypothetical protein